MQYERSIYGYIEEEQPRDTLWQPSEFESGNVFGFWLQTFDWDKHSIAYQGSQTDQGETVIVFTVTEAPNNSGHYEEFSYTVNFYFDKDGVLETVVQTFVEPEMTDEGVPTYSTTIATMHIYPTDAAEIAHTIDAHYQEAISQ